MCAIHAIGLLCITEDAAAQIYADATKKSDRTDSLTNQWNLRIKVKCRPIGTCFAPLSLVI